MAVLLLVFAFFLAMSSSRSIFFSRNSCFFISISSVSLNFWIASPVVGAVSPFFPKIFPKKLILRRNWTKFTISTFRGSNFNFQWKEVKEHNHRSLHDCFLFYCVEICGYEHSPNVPSSRNIAFTKSPILDNSLNLKQFSFKQDSNHLNYLSTINIYH